VPEQVFHHVEWMLNLGADLSFDPLPLGDQSLVWAFFHLLKLAALLSHVSDYIQPLELWAFGHAGITCVRVSFGFITVQQMFGLSDRVLRQVEFHLQGVQSLVEKRPLEKALQRAENRLRSGMGLH